MVVEEPLVLCGDDGLPGDVGHVGEADRCRADRRDDPPVDVVHNRRLPRPGWNGPAIRAEA